jgi:hydroxyethylthiazole kinase-like uncharacterized protein yjeF
LRLKSQEENLMKLVTVEQMQKIEQEADSKGTHYAIMMERAGKGLAEAILELSEEPRIVLALIGSGNNGGDALVALTHLLQHGWKARAYLVLPRPENDPLLDEYTKLGGEFMLAEKDRGLKRLDEALQSSQFLLDGVFGTGFKLPVKGNTAAVLKTCALNPSRPFTIAIDCPSGVNCETGETAPETIPADLTVVMGAFKTGQFRMPAFPLMGDLHLVDLDLPEDLAAWKATDWQVVSEEDVISWLPERQLDGHKGTFGTLTIAAGSVNFTGAALLSGLAAARTGVGLVQMAVPASIHSAIASHLPDATWVLLPHEMGVLSEKAADVLLDKLAGSQTLLLGPGLGVEPTTEKLVAALFQTHHSAQSRGSIGFIKDTHSVKEIGQNKLPSMVIDADGLKLLAKIQHWWTFLPTGSILTPHPGEMAVLTGESVLEIQSNRMDVAVRYAKQWNVVVVLKGAFTVIADPDGRSALIPVATSALAHAGAGDVLAGMIASLSAQGVNPFEAASAGAWLHAQCALLAAEQSHPAAVLASDLPDLIGFILSELDE